MAQRVADEEELVLHPAFFAALADDVPAIERCDVLVKCDQHDNEMTWFRYDVIIHTVPDRRGVSPRNESRGRTG